jgi:hypothetical protein
MELLFFFKRERFEVGHFARRISSSPSYINIIVIIINNLIMIFIIRSSILILSCIAILIIPDFRIYGFFDFLNFRFSMSSFLKARRRFSGDGPVFGAVTRYGMQT